MRYLHDPLDKRMYEVCYEEDRPNYGLAGGTNHVLVVRNAVEEPKWRDTTGDSLCTHERCHRAPQATDGRLMGPIERARCVELFTEA